MFSNKIEFGLRVDDPEMSVGRDAQVISDIAVLKSKLILVSTIKINFTISLFNIPTTLAYVQSMPIVMLWKPKHVTGYAHYILCCILICETVVHHKFLKKHISLNKKDISCKLSILAQVNHKINIDQIQCDVLNNELLTKWF